MATRYYNSVNGVIRGHYDHGVPNSEVMYVRDGLGSVVATVDARGNVLNQYHYKPWGELWQKTGSAPDPRFLWAGSWGYRAYGNKWVSHYVRARHYSTPDGAWTTFDPLWPSERAYGYVEGRVTGLLDYYGLRPSGPVTCDPQWNEYIYNYCGNCYRNKPYNDVCRFRCDSMARTYYERCGKGIPGPGMFAPPRKGFGTVAPRGPTYDPGSSTSPLLMPFTFAYGNCCGLGKKCSCADAMPGGRALDCLDEACARHDECLGTPLQYALFQAQCDRALCKDLESCSCEPHSGAARERCEDAKWRMMSLYCPIGAVAEVPWNDLLRDLLRTGPTIRI